MTGNELKELRTNSDLSRPKLARLAGIHPDAVKYWEKKSQVDIRGFAPSRILRALGRVDLLAKPKRTDRRKTGEFSRTVTRARHGVWGRTSFVSPKKCGARTRQGTPCEMKPVSGKRRCRLHGGLSSSPRGCKVLGRGYSSQSEAT